MSVAAAVPSAPWPLRERRAAHDATPRATYAPDYVRGRTVLCAEGDPQAHHELVGCETLLVEDGQALMRCPDDDAIGRDWLENFCRLVEA